LKDRCQKLGLRGGDLAALVGISAPKISNFFKGRTALDSAKTKEVTDTLSALERLKNFFPIPIGCHDIRELALALERLRQGKFNSFQKLMAAIDWTPPEGLERKFPKIKF